MSTLFSENSDFVSGCQRTVPRLPRFILEWFEAPLEYAVHVGDGDAVVYDGDAGFFGGEESALHFFVTQHAAAAVDDECVVAELVGEALAGAEEKFRFCTGEFFNPAGEFDCADVVALSVMGAAFGNQDFITIFQF